MDTSETIRSRRAPIKWLLFATFIHTLPSFWFAFVAAGFEPAIVLVIRGFPSSFYLDQETTTALFWFGLPGLAYFLIYFVAALGLAAIFARVTNKPLRTGLVTLLVAALFTASMFPIYVFGGHNTSTEYNLIASWEAARLPLWAAGFYIATLVALVIALLWLQYRELWLPRGLWRSAWSHPLKRAIIMVTPLILATLFVSKNHVLLVCRPLAELGIAQAQFCLGEAKRARPNRLWGDESTSTWLTRAAQQGHAEAALLLAQSSSDRGDYIRWLTISAENGSATAMYALYHALLRVSEGDAQAAEGIRWLIAAAEAGFADAQFDLARAIEQGRLGDYGIEFEARAVKDWYQRAADQGHRLARQWVATALAVGAGGFELDHDKAAAMYRELAAETRQEAEATGRGMALADEYLAKARAIEMRAAEIEAGNRAVVREEALRLLAVKQPSRGVRAQALDTLERLAKDGDGEAGWELGSMYIHGRYGMEKDVEKGRQWWLVAADAGHLEAMERIASAYLNGNLGLTRDFTRGRPYVEALITAYSSGPSADPNDERRWRRELQWMETQIEMMGGRYESPAALETRVRRGDPDAQYQLARQMFGTDPRRAVELYRAAAAAGHTEAHWDLFTLYRFGRWTTETTGSGTTRYDIVPQDDQKAGEHLMAAAAGHHPQAMLELGLAYEKGRYGIERNLEKARDQYIENITAAEQDLYGWEVDERYVKFQKRYLEVVENILAYQATQETE